jgi:nuclear-control-of-ATPase protein 2
LISKFPYSLFKGQELPDETVAYVLEVSWIMAAKAFLQVLGITFNVLLEHTHSIGEEAMYWADVSGSNWYTGAYAVQTAPGRLWHFLRRSLLHMEEDGIRKSVNQTASVSWARFYNIVHRCIDPRAMLSLRARLLSSFTAHRSEIRQKCKALGAMRVRNASGIGLLMAQCSLLKTKINPEFATDDRLRDAVFRGVLTLKVLLQRVVHEGTEYELEERVITAVEREIVRSQSEIAKSPQTPEYVIEQLFNILDELLPDYSASSRRAISHHGRPSCLVRYWLPLSVGVLSTSTFVRLLSSRQHELIRWISDIGLTACEFWGNWVVEPTRRLIGTIRHDEKSEIALMSKNSLEADRASLERMVLDFVLDRPESEKELGAKQIDTITARIREGDLTPVLRAYEKDLRKPFIGTVRGDLVRALLIQIQKTKVDVEIAIGGIDSLLKSQELVFGYGLSFKN